MEDWVSTENFHFRIQIYFGMTCGRYTDCEEPVRSGPKHIRLDLSNTGDHVVLLVLKCNIEVSQHGGVPRYMLNGCKEVVFHPDKQTTLLPRVLKIQRLEVVPQASLS